METEPVRKIQRLYDERDRNWYDVYTAPGIAGELIVATVPREEQASSAVRKALLRKGADLPPEVAGRDALIAAIATDAPVVTRAARTGWRNDDRVFVSNAYIAGEVEGSTVVPPENAVSSVLRLQVRGTLEGWQSLLLGIVEHSTALIIALCAAFAAALLKLVRRPNFGVVLVGPSRSGKSTAQLTGASVLGSGSEEELPSLNATDAGLLAAALASNDQLLAINEIGTARGAKKDTYVTLRNSTYALMNGQDIMRHPSWTGASDGVPGTFRTIVVMSSELSPDAWAARNGETRDEGEMARLIGVPVLYPGRRTIFDRPPVGLRGGAFAAWRTEQFRLLREGLPQHCGTAFPAYLDALVSDVPACGAMARKAVAQFVRVVAKSSMTPIARDIVAKFGVLYAGGILAHRTGVLRWDRKVMAQAVRRACLAALAELPDPEGELRAGLDLLRERLSGGSIVDLDACTGKQRRLIRHADGYHQPKNAGRQFVVRAQVFAGWFGSALRLRRVLEWIDDEGLLDHGRERTRSRSIEWAQKQVTWPDQTRVRSISIFLPAGLTDLIRS